MNNNFRFEYKFNIVNYQSDISIIHAEFNAPMRSKTSKISMVLPTKIGEEKMKHIVKMRCEKQVELSSTQREFINQRTVKNCDLDLFQAKVSADFDEYYEKAKKAREFSSTIESNKIKFDADYSRLIKYGVPAETAAKIVDLTASGHDILEMSNGIYYADENGSPKLIEKFCVPGVGLLAYNVHKSIKLKRGA